MDRKPAAYIRKSQKLEESAAARLAAVEQVAARDGVNGDLVVYSDVGVSGRRNKRTEKSAWARLLDDIAADEFSTGVCVGPRPRRPRTLLVEWLLFSELLVEHGVRLVDQTSQEPGGRRQQRRGSLRDVGRTEGRLQGGRAIGAGVPHDEGARRRDGRRVQSYIWIQARQGGRRRLDGDPNRIVVVPNPDEPIDPLLDAIKATKGNVLQAARRLDALGVPYRAGGPWNVRVLTEVLEREGALKPRHGSRLRRRAASDAPLSRLVECYCGRLMTPQRDRRNGKWLSLLCMPGCRAGLKVHGRYVARSRHVIELLQRELHYSTIRVQKSAGTTDVSHRRAALEVKREKLQVARDNDVVSVEEFKRRVAQLKRDIEAINNEVAAESTGRATRRANRWSIGTPATLRSASRSERSSTRCDSTRTCSRSLSTGARRGWREQRSPRLYDAIVVPLPGMSVRRRASHSRPCRCTPRAHRELRGSAGPATSQPDYGAAVRTLPRPSKHR